MSIPPKPTRRGPFLTIPLQNGTTRFVVLVSYKGVEHTIGKYSTQAEATAAYQNHLLSRTLQLFEPLTADQKQHLQTAARDYPALASFLGRLSLAWQQLHYPNKRANKSYTKHKEHIQ